MHIGTAYRRLLEGHVPAREGGTMDVRQLEYFLAVVDHGGFNRAATAL